MSHEPAASGFAAYQAAFARRIRAPRTAPLPLGASKRRMRAYEELLYTAVEGFLLACYPVTRAVLGARKWTQLVRPFFAEHGCHSPLFRDIPKEFLDFWLKRPGLWPELPFLFELMHYEWLELDVSIHGGEVNTAQIDPHGDMRTGRLALQPSAVVACYRFPVHAVRPRFKPLPEEGAVYCYLLFRDDADEVRFIRLDPSSAQLLQLIQTHEMSVQQALEQLYADEAPHDMMALRASALEFLSALQVQGVVLGVWR